jgi:superfamily II DNA or RNA helicase
MDLECLSHIRLSTGYRTGEQDLISEFYVPCLSASSRYDRAAGYFHSTLYVLVGVALSDFAQRGGLVRLVCSPHLYREDIAAIREGLDLREKVNGAFQESVRVALGQTSDLPVVRLLATLVACRALDIRLALRPSSSGIFHDKIGIFADADGHRVSFIGSTNETYSAWHPEANHEGFEVFRDWVSEDAKERVDRHQAYFERLWKGRETGVEVCELTDLSHEMLEGLADPSGIDSAAEKVRLTVRRRIAPVDAQAGNEITLQPHQVDALTGWEERSFRGILAHATGSGKTITALEAIRRWLASGRPALVVVPSELLAIQWKREAERYLGEYTLLQIGGSESDPAWRDLLSDATRDAPQMGPRLTIATIQTAAGDDFLKHTQSGGHLLLVADEVHRFGAPGYSRVLGINAGARLGLSATPERYGDPEGTSKIMEYFGGIIPPPFTLKDAIAAGRLVPYDYFAHTVALTEEEQQAWDDLTHQVGVEYARTLGSTTRDTIGDRLKMLLILRARILKKAKGKVALAKAVISKEYEAGDRWLVYCDDTEQLRDVLAGLATEGLPVFEYHSVMEGNKAATIDYFTHDGGIVVAIKCLDEGIDIPVVSKALILASSSNPREFIQRRGRVLRRTEDKVSAEVHDAFVLPARRGAEDATRSILATELRRAIQFADTARNSATRFQLHSIAATYGVPISRPAGQGPTFVIESEDPS